LGEEFVPGSNIGGSKLPNRSISDKGKQYGAGRADAGEREVAALLRGTFEQAPADILRYLLIARQGAPL
jgi:hypothetical protein